MKLTNYINLVLRLTVPYSVAPSVTHIHVHALYKHGVYFTQLIIDFIISCIQTQLLQISQYF